VIGSDHAMWWSPEGTYLLYAQFNDTEVPIYTYPFYGDPDKAYTQQKTIAYPKVINMNIGTT
jgi:hypothetical protein